MLAALPSQLLRYTNYRLPSYYYIYRLAPLPYVLADLQNTKCYKGLREAWGLHTPRGGRHSYTGRPWLWAEGKQHSCFRMKNEQLNIKLKQYGRYHSYFVLISQVEVETEDFHTPVGNSVPSVSVKYQKVFLSSLVKVFYLWRQTVQLIWQNKSHGIKAAI